MAAGLLGPPGVYFESVPPPFAFANERMDICAFLGVAPRGPSRLPIVDPAALREQPLRRVRRSIAVAVESFDEYRRLYGAFEGPGLLPYAVRAFFEQGGTRAYIVRIVRDYGDEARNAAGASIGRLPGLQDSNSASVNLRARNEGAWGDRLKASVTFSARSLVFDRARSTATDLVLGPETVLPPGTTLRVTTAPGIRAFNSVSVVTLAPRSAASGRDLRATFAQPLTAPPLGVDVVEATLTLDDGDGRTEVHEALGLDPRHPRWIAQVLRDESELVLPEEAWREAALEPIDERLLPASIDQFSGGEDRSSDILPGDFFDATWTLGDDEPGDGVHALVQLDDLAMVCAPDLYSPRPLPDFETILDPPNLAGPEFACCVEAVIAKQAIEPPDLIGLRLDPRLPSDLEQIVTYQQKLVELADLLRVFTVLLDVPPGLQPPQILRWRKRFSSAFAAAYHPWIAVAPEDDNRDALIRVPPSAVAAGIIAAQEHRYGVPHGPANVIARGAVALDREVLSADHAEMHAAGINVYVRDPDGFRLTSARTLSGDPSYRQLSVRRLITQLARTLEHQTQWMVFEPNTEALRADLVRALEVLLRQLFVANAFAGQTEEEAFFVRCDDELNDQRAQDAGRLIAEIGVAPAEPLEFLVVRLIRDLDGRISVES